MRWRGDRRTDSGGTRPSTRSIPCAATIRLLGPGVNRSGPRRAARDYQRNPSLLLDLRCHLLDDRGKLAQFRRACPNDFCTSTVRTPRRKRSSSIGSCCRMGGFDPFAEDAAGQKDRERDPSPPDSSTYGRALTTRAGTERIRRRRPRHPAVSASTKLTPFKPDDVVALSRVQFAPASSVAAIVPTAPMAQQPGAATESTFKSG